MGGFVVKEKLKLLKVELKKWKEEIFGCLDSSIEHKKLEIEQLDLIDDIFGLDSDEIEKKVVLMDELLKESR